MKNSEKVFFKISLSWAWSQSVTEQNEIQQKKVTKHIFILMFTIKTFHKALVNFFVMMNTDFNIVKLKKFKNLLLICQLNLNISKWTVLTELIESCAREIESLIYCSLLKNWKILLVINVWSSLNQLLFLNVITYFVNDNWKF